jgi:hypothetical protein
MRHRLCAALLATILVCLASSAHAAGAAPASSQSNYSCTFPNSIYYGPDTLRVIWKPLATLPALVRPGDVLTVWATAPNVPTNWSASLGFGALNVPLASASAAFQSNLGWWVLGFTVPAGVPEELYSFRLSSDTGISDSTLHSVKVLPAFKTDYYFAQISDTHLPEHTFSDNTSFNTCDTTGMADFDAVIADLNLIHPEFILHTGDLVNEGDLDTLYQMNEMGRALQMVYRLRDPMFLASGNHDIGGFSTTPVPVGTSRLDWRRFYGWPWLGNPPAGAPYHSQLYTFDYDSLRCFGIETYINYDGYQSGLYGGGSMTAEEMTWLQQQIAAAGPLHKLLFYHFDFDQGANTGSTSGPWQLNIPSLGVDGAIWGHYHTVPENSKTPYTAHPFDLGLQSVIDGHRSFRIFRVHNGNISPGPMHHSGTTTDSLSAAWNGPNDGTQARLSVTVTNRFGESWEHSKLMFVMADHDSAYGATGGTVTSTIRQGGMVDVYVDCVLPASGNVTVSVFPTTPFVGVALPAPSTGLWLARVAPNPYRGHGSPVTLRYSLPSAVAVSIGVYDVHGRKVARLLDGRMGAGEHELAWDGRTMTGQAAPAGTYVVRLKAGGAERSRKLSIIP